MGVLLRRVLDGHERVAEWSADDEASIEEARQLLRQELDAGYIAVPGDGNEPVTELPVDAEAVILTMPMGGG